MPNMVSIFSIRILTDAIKDFQLNVPICMCFTKSYNDHRMGMMRRSKNKIEKSMTVTCPLEPENSTDTNMCLIQWAKDITPKLPKAIQNSLQINHSEKRKWKKSNFIRELPTRNWAKKGEGGGFENNFIFISRTSTLCFSASKIALFIKILWVI